MTNKSCLLDSLGAENRLELMSRMSDQPTWRFVGLFFAKTHDFTITYASLQAKYNAKEDLILCHHLIEELSSRGIYVDELAAVLRKSFIGMTAVADRLHELALECINSPSSAVSSSDSSQNKTPELSSLYAVNKFLVMAQNADEISSNVDELLKQRAFKPARQEHNFVLWKKEHLEYHDFYMLVLPLNKQDLLSRIEELLEHAGDILFVTMHNKENSPRSVVIQKPDLQAMDDEFFWLPEVAKTNGKEHSGYSISKHDVAELHLDKYLLKWTQRLAPKTAKSACLEFKLKNTVPPENAVGPVTSVVEGKCGIKIPHTGHRNGSTVVYLLAPSIILAIVRLQYDKIDIELRLRGLELEKITQVSQEEVISAMESPSNEKFVNNLHELICHMDLNGVPVKSQRKRLVIEYGQRWDQRGSKPSNRSFLTDSPLLIRSEMHNDIHVQENHLFLSGGADALFYRRLTRNEVRNMVLARARENFPFSKTEIVTLRVQAIMQQSAFASICFNVEELMSKVNDLTEILKSNHLLGPGVFDIKDQIEGLKISLEEVKLEVRENSRNKVPSLTPSRLQLRTTESPQDRLAQCQLSVFTEQEARIKMEATSEKLQSCKQLAEVITNRLQAMVESNKLPQSGKWKSASDGWSIHIVTAALNMLSASV